MTALGIPEVIEGLLCCTSSALSAACSKCSIGHPRFVFSFFLICATVASFLVVSPNMRPLLDKIPYFCTAVTTNEMCDSLVGYGAVYRICFSLVIFHAIFAILMLNTTSTNDIRFKLHNGYWFLKLVLLVLISMGTFHIPKYTEFGRIWMYAGLTGGFMFIMIQIILIIDFAHSWSISWVEKVDTGNTNFWYIALAFCTIIIYSVAITMAIFFYLYFTDLRNLTKCRGNLFLITFNLSQCFLASFISVLPQVQDESHGSGLLQSSIVTLYVMYLTWCTLSSEPDASCNPLGDVILEYDKATGVNGQALFDCVLMFALLLFACNVRTNTSKLEKLGLSLSKLTVAKKYEYIDTFDESSLKNREKNDDEFVEYNYSYFHFVMLLASLQLMMVVTNWHSPHEMADMKKLVKNWATVWIQLSASFLCMLFYIWAMVAPLLVRTWGPCLGLDYERVPMDDDYEYGRSRRRTDAIFAEDDVMEKLESGKNFRKVDKSRQTTTDSGMFDTNATTSYSISRVSLRPSSSKSIRSDVHEPKFTVASENTGDMGQTTLDNRLIADEQNQTSDGLGREILERPQSRQSAVDEGNGDAVILRSSQSYSNLKESTKEGKTLKKSPRKQNKISSTEIKDIVIDLSQKDEIYSRPPSRIVVNERILASEDEDSNRLPSTNEGSIVMSTGEANEGLRTLSRSGTKDLSHEEKEIGITRKTSSAEKDDIGIDRKISSNDQSPCSGAGVEVSQSRLSDEEQDGQTTSISGRSSPRSGRLSMRIDRTSPRSNRMTPRSDRTTPRSDRPIPLDKMNRAPNSCSRGVVTTKVENERPKSSAQELVNHRTTSSRHVGNNRVSSDKSRPIFLEMEDHLGWVKRLRKSKNNLNDDNRLENRQLKTKIDQLTSTDNDKINVRSLKEENSIKTLNKSKENQTRVDKSLKSVKINRSQNKDKTKYKKDDSAIKRPPLNVQPVTNSFTNSLQQPDVSKEILRLQARILKFQAKVVKTQQQILNMQDDEEKRRQSPQKNPT